MGHHGDLRALVLRARESENLATRNAAFEDLVILLQDFAVGSAFAYLRDVGLAEDAAQDSFVTAWRLLDRLRDPNLFLAWLKRIIASHCHRVLRKKRNRSGIMRDDVDQPDTGFEELVSRKERSKLVCEALEQLPAKERVAVVLFYFSGRSQKAMADFLGVPPTTIAKRLFSARRRLQAALSPLRLEIGHARPSRNRQFAAIVRAGIYDDYVGLYRFGSRPDLTVRVERVGNRLVSFSAGQKNSIISGSRLSDLRAREFDGHAQFIRSRSGRVTHFIYYEGGKRMGLAKKEL